MNTCHIVEYAMSLEVAALFPFMPLSVQPKAHPDTESIT